MQALFFLALFGFLMALLSGLTSGTALGSMRLMDLQREDTERFFQDIAFLMNQHVTSEHVKIPTQSAMTDYLELPIIKQASNWSWGSTLADPWRRDIFIYAVYEEHAIRGDSSVTPNIVVQPQATAFVLASRGPDGVFDSTLESTLNALSSGSSISDIMRIEATAGTDDIVHTFNNRRALEARWERMEWNMDQLGSIALSRYRQDYDSTTFNAALEAYSIANLDSIMALVGSLEDNLSDWKKTVLAGTPDMANYDNIDDTSSSDFIRFLEETEDENVRVDIVAEPRKSDPSYAVFDTMRLNAEKPAGATGGWSWQNEAGQFHYHIEIGDEE